MAWSDKARLESARVRHLKALLNKRWKGRSPRLSQPVMKNPAKKFALKAPWPVPTAWPNLGKSETTQKRYKRDGEYTRARKALHRKIYARTLDSIPRSSSPTIYFMGGGPAAGKSTVKDSDTSSSGGRIRVPDRKHAVHMEPDEWQKRFPEYEHMLRRGVSPSDVASSVHKEASEMADEMAEHALNGGFDTVFDGTGDHSPQELREDILALRKHGYPIKAMYVTCSVAKAREFADIRVKLENRRLPDEILQIKHKSVSLAFMANYKLFDKVELWDTEKGYPVLIARGRRGRNLKIFDEDAFARFVNKGYAEIEESS